jgi:ketosteroid isomerase-like protein
VETEDIIDAHGDRETVLVLLRATGKAAYTGLDIEVEWAAVWTIRNGKLLRAQGYLSRADAVEAAGLSE